MSPQEGAEEAEEGNPGGGDVCGLTQWRSQALSHVTKTVHHITYIHTACAVLKAGSARSKVCLVRAALCRLGGAFCWVFP